MNQVKFNFINFMINFLNFSKRIFLREILKDDLNDNYLSWLRDNEVNCFLETRHQKQNLKTIKEYWISHKNDILSPWFAICLRDNNKHIGNIKLGPINQIHKRADVSLFIGEKSLWGKGYASEAIYLICKLSFERLGLRKLNASIYKSNKGSINLFEKSGFILEGTLREEGFYEDKPRDVLRYGLLRNEFQDNIF